MTSATDNRTTELLMREFVAVACECEVRDYLIAEYAERIEQAVAATLGWIDEPDTIRNELADGGLITDVVAPVCVDEKERNCGAEVVKQCTS